MFEYAISACLLVAEQFFVTVNFVLIVAGGIAEYIAGLPAEASIPTIIAGCLSIIVRFLTNDSLRG